MLHQRIELFSEFDCKLRYTLTRLVDRCLHGVVEDCVLVGGRRALAERFGCLTHLPTEEVEVGGKVGEHRRHTGAVEAEVLEQRRQDGQSLVLAQFAEGFEEHHHALRGAFIERFNKSVRFKTNLFRHFGRFLEQLHNGTLQSRGRHFHLLAVRVERCGKSHNLGDSHFGGRADAGHTLRKLYDKRLGGGAVLREVVDRRADFEHRVTHTIHLLHTEDVRQLGNGLRGPLSEVDERHVDNRRGLDILADGGDSIVAESSALLGEQVQLLTGKTGVHALEDLVEFFNLGGGHTGVLYGVSHSFLDVRIRLHRLTSGHNKPRDGGGNCHYDCLRRVEPPVEALPKGLLCGESGVYLLEFRFEHTDFSDVRIPSGGASLQSVELLLELAQGCVELLWSGLVEPQKHLLGSRGGAFQLLHSLACGVQLALQLLHRGLVTCDGCFRYPVFQTLCVLFELG